MAHYATHPYSTYFGPNFNILGASSSYLSICAIQAGCDQTTHLICSLTTDNVYICLCPAYFYWSFTLLTCQVQLTGGDACALTTDCRGDLGLYCDTLVTNTCVCTATFYWTGLTCSKPLSITLN